MKCIKAPSILFFLLSVFALLSCEEKQVGLEPSQTVSKDTVMPAYTDTGANTLAYKVNGEVIRSANWINYTTGIVALRMKSIDPQEGYLLVVEGQTVTRSKYQSVVIKLSNVLDTGKYIAKESNLNNYNQMQYIIGKDADINSTYVTTDLHKGYIHLKKLDTLNKIAAGTFYFTGKLFLWGEEKDTLQISEGQFDVKFQ